MDFTDDQILQLINEYEKYPVLWNPKDKFYKLNNKKKNAWDAIASVFETNGDVLKKKNELGFKFLSPRASKSEHKMFWNGCK
jgi:hypothetical protein